MYIVAALLYDLIYYYQSGFSPAIGGEALSRAEPPAGPPKLKMLQFSCKQSEISSKNRFSGQHADLDSNISQAKTYSRKHLQDVADAT